jgi:hypothetical protein
MAQTHPASDLQGKFQEWQAPEKVSKQRMFWLWNAIDLE